MRIVGIIAAAALGITAAAADGLKKRQTKPVLPEAAHAPIDAPAPVAVIVAHGCGMNGGSGWRRPDGQCASKAREGCRRDPSRCNYEGVPPRK